MKNPYTLGPEESARREAEIIRLSKNREIRRLLKEMRKDEAFLAANSSRFKLYLEHLQVCKGCQGLDFCRQKLRGTVQELFLDDMGYLNERFVPCRFAREKNSSEAHKANYTVSHLDDADLQIDLAKVDLQNQSASYAQTYVRVLSTIQEPKGLYLYGEPGTGKTYLLTGLANRLAKSGTKVCFVKAGELVSEIKTNLKDDAFRESLLFRLKNTPVLFLDDIGAEQVSAWTRDSVLFPVLEYRMTHHKKTYFTSNFSLTELEKRYILSETSNERVQGMRMLERIRAMSTPVKLTGYSRRYTESTHP